MKQTPNRWDCIKQTTVWAYPNILDLKSNILRAQELTENREETEKSAIGGTVASAKFNFLQTTFHILDKNYQHLVLSSFLFAQANYSK